MKTLDVAVFRGIESGRWSNFKMAESQGKPRLFLLLILVLLLPRGIQSQAPTAGVLLAQFSSSRMVAGDESLVRIGFTIKDGFKISKRPSPKFQPNPNPEFEIKIPVIFSDIKESGDPEYFSGLKPLELHLVPAKATKPGRYSIEAKLTYFYCSEKDKYCSRSMENLKIPIEVIREK